MIKKQVTVTLAVAGMPSHNGNIFSRTLLHKFVDQLKSQVYDGMAHCTIEIPAFRNSSHEEKIFGRVVDAWVTAEGEFKASCTVDTEFKCGESVNLLFNTDSLRWTFLFKAEDFVQGSVVPNDAQFLRVIAKLKDPEPNIFEELKSEMEDIVREYHKRVKEEQSIQKTKRVPGDYWKVPVGPQYYWMSWN